MPMIKCSLFWAMVNINITVCEILIYLHSHVDIKEALTIEDRSLVSGLVNFHGSMAPELTKLNLTECNVMKRVTSNKSNLLLKIILENTQTLQLFTKIIKTESKYKMNSDAKLGGLVDEIKWSN
jgi:hypothetical protein